jgi:hypothetical protein
MIDRAFEAIPVGPGTLAQALAAPAVINGMTQAIGNLSAALGRPFTHVNNWPAHLQVK